jgi:SNF2 family DNA or RNA helicase
MLGDQRIRVGKAKARYFAQNLTSEVLGRHKRVVVWFWHQEVLSEFKHSLWERDQRPVDVVTGATGPKKRAEVVHEWRHGSTEEPRILLATLAAMGSAVNLTTAEAEVFLEYDYAPLMVQQAEARVHRPGSCYPEVWSYYVVARGTVDDKIAKALLVKVDEVEKVFGADLQGDQIREIINGGWED